MRRIRALLLPALAGFAVLTACEKPLTVEQRVIATIRDMEASIEAGERRNFMQHIAADFTGQGGINRDQARALVVYQLNRHKNLQAQLFPIRVVERNPNSAEASFRALVTGGPGWIPENGQLFDFETHWVRVDDEWLLQAATWTPVRLDGAL